METIEEKSFEYKENVDLSNICDTKDVRFEIQDAFKAGAQFAIDELASKFEQLKQSATTLRDVVYLDGVLTVIESMKIENNN